MSSAITPSASIEAATMRKVALRLIPFLVLCYFIAYVDRVNVGFAALTMNKDLGLSTAAFGFGGGLFFVAYVLFEVPSNLAMEKVGARLWIARIMITWGLVGFASAFVTGAVSFSVARFFLGAAEAGFFPRRDPVSDLLVPESLPRPHRRHVHGRDPALQLLRITHFRCAAHLGRDGRAARLAMAADHGGHPRRAARHRRSGHAAEPTRRGEVPDADRKAVARKPPWRPNAASPWPGTAAATARSGPC